MLASCEGRASFGRRVKNTFLAAATLLASETCQAPPPAPTQEREPTPTTFVKPEAPKTLPKDIISYDVLAEKYNTHIWNTEKVKLHLREKALETTIFKDFLAKLGNKIKLQIILLDGPGVSLDYLPEEFKKDSYAVAAADREKGKAAGAFYWNGNRIYILVAAGLARRPKPRESYLSPSQLGFYTNDEGESLIMRETSSLILRHELEHITGRSHNEVETAVYESLVKAWEALENGDDSYYWVVFETEEGFTISYASSPEKGALPKAECIKVGTCAV